MTPEERARAAVNRQSLRAYDPTLGGLLPAIGLSPGALSVAPSSAGDTDSAAELRALERIASERRRGRAEEDQVSSDDASAPAPGSREWFQAAQDPTRAEGLFDASGSPMIQPQRGIGRQLGVRSQDDLALEELARGPGVTAALAMGDALTLPRVVTGLAGDDYRGTQRTIDDLLDRGREEHPAAWAGGMLTGIAPQMLAPALLGESAVARLGGAAAGSSVPALSRVGAAGLEGATLGLAHGLATGDPERATQEALVGGGLGAGAAGLAQGAASLSDAARRAVPGMEETAARYRVRASGGRTVAVQRAMNNLPGGSVGVADDLRALGISPRYSVHTVDDARAVADRVRGDAGRRVGRAFDVMEEARAAAQAAQATPQHVGGYRSPAVANDLSEAGQGLVDTSPIASALDRIAESYGAVPSGARGEAAASAMARDYRATGPMPYGRPSGPSGAATGAQRELELLDEAINWQPGTNPVNDRMGAIQRDLRSVRSGLRSQMDEAVSAVDPELGARLPRDRREYQLSKIISNLGEDNALRDSANRLVSPTDYAAGMVGDSMWGTARNVLMNRLLRGREASAAAAGLERGSDLFSRAPDLRDASNLIAGRVGRARPPSAAPAQAGTAPPAVGEPEDDGLRDLTYQQIQALPELDVGRVDDLPELTDDDVGGVSDAEFQALPELSDDEYDALPVME